MNKNVVIVVLGVAVVLLGGILLGTGCGTADPPFDPPPTPTPTPEPQAPCEYWTIEFTSKEPWVYASIEHLDDAQECAMIIFSNKTDKAIKIEFLDSNLPTKSPFAGIEAIELEPYGEETQFSKGFTVTVEVPENVPYLQYKYVVAEFGPPETEQSPRIRIGPRQATTNEGE